MNHMKEVAKTIAGQLRRIANCMEIGEQAEGPSKIFKYTFLVGKGSYKIQCEYTPTGLRERADRLEKSARKFGNGQTLSARECDRASRWKPSSRQPTASERLAIIKRMKEKCDGLPEGVQANNALQLEALSPGQLKSKISHFL